MKKHLLLIINCLLLCCTITFAWILSGEAEIVKNLFFDYTGDDKLVIASVKADISIVFLDGEEEIPVDDFELDPEIFVPDAMIPFRVKFDYQASDDERSPITVCFSLEGITVSDPALLEHVYISVTPANDALLAPNGPRTIYKCLNTATPSSDGSTYTLEIYDLNNRLHVPHDEENESVLECYFWFDKDAGADMQNMWIDIASFRFE